MKLKCVYNFIERLFSFALLMLVTEPQRTMSNQHSDIELWSAQSPTAMTTVTVSPPTNPILRLRRITPVDQASFAR